MSDRTIAQIVAMILIYMVIHLIVELIRAIKWIRRKYNVLGKATPVPNTNRACYRFCGSCTVRKSNIHRMARRMKC